MRIIIKHQGITKILTQATTLKALRTYTIQNFDLIYNKEQYKNLYYQYTDLEGDKIMVASEQDFKMMLQTVKGLYVKMELVEEANNFNCCPQADNLDDINRSRLISQNSVKGKQYADKQLGEPQIVKQLITPKKESQMSKITNRTFRIPQEDIIKFEQSLPTPIKNYKTQEISNYELSKKNKQSAKTVPLARQMQCPQAEAYSTKVQLQKQRLQDNLQIFLDDRINQLINQKIQKMMPTIQNHIRKQLQQNKIQQSRQNQSSIGQKLANKMQCRHKVQKGRIQNKIKAKIKQQSIKLSQRFKGKPSQYESFVQQNFGSKTRKLMQIYQKQFLKKNKTQAADVQIYKIQKRIRKLGTYYSQNPQHFRQFVQKNPQLKFPQLLQNLQKGLKKVKQSQSLKTIQFNKFNPKNLVLQIPNRKNRNFSQYQVQKQSKFVIRKERIMTGNSHKEQSGEFKPKIQYKYIPQQSERVLNFKKSKVMHKDAQIAKSQQNKDVSRMSPKQEITKKAQFLILFKELFGVQNIKEYLQFYKNSKGMNERQLVQKWIKQRF